MSGRLEIDAGAADLETVGWSGDAFSGVVHLIDQTKLPSEFVRIQCAAVPSVWEAIRSLRVRGAPAIGIAAAFGAVLGARQRGWEEVSKVRTALKEAADSLRTSRPTAVNLFWALDRMESAAASQPATNARDLLNRLLAEEARAIADEDCDM